MPRKKRDASENGGRPSGSGFIETVFGFFSGVHKSIGTDVLRVLWGIAVLLFVILAFMTWFGKITGDQAFTLAIIIIVSIIIISAVFLFALTWSPSAPERTKSSSTSDAAHPELAEQVRKCLNLLTEIQRANARIIARGNSEAGHWATILRDNYNNVCHICYHRRSGPRPPPDPYFDTICAAPDVDTVCARKWELGEALDDYRDRLDRVSPVPLEHHDLELLIRRSVTQPNRTPSELDAAVAQTIKAAKRVLRSHT